MFNNRNISGNNVAVVGGAGFLGSHLVDYLVEVKDCKVTVIDNLISGRKEFIHPKAEFVHADITTSEDYLRRVFVGNDVRFVFNYAASPYVPLSYDRPGYVCNVNFTGALNVIHAAHSAKVEAILQVSSAEIYGDFREMVGEEAIQKGCKISEKMHVVPHSSYGASKAAIDFLVQCRWKEAKVPCISLRQFNCLGERETHPYVVPEIISQLYRGDERTVKLGNNSSRDFLYAEDAVRMAVELLEKGQFGEVYNLGSQESISIYTLAQRIANVLGCGHIRVERDEKRVRPWEIWHLQSDNTKIYGVITERPKVSLDEAIKRTADWFVINGKKWGWEK